MRERLDYIDVSKGFGMLLVILGHVYLYTDNPIMIWIYSFHMPLFFIISGGLLSQREENRNFKSILISKIKAFLVPYFSMCFISIIIYFVLGVNNISTTKALIFKSLLLFGLDSLWYLPCIFIAELMLILINKHLKGKYTLAILSSLLASITFILSLKSNSLFNIVILRSFIALAFLSLGYYSFNWIRKTEPSYLTIISLLLTNIIVCFNNGEKFVEIWGLKFYNPILYIISAVSGSLATIFFFKRINTKNKILMFCGKNSLPIMMTQQFLITLVWHYIGTPFSSYILLSVMILILEVPIVYLINNYTPWMIGKFKKREK